MSQERIGLRGEIQDYVTVERGKYTVGRRLKAALSPDFKAAPELEVMTYWEMPDGNATVYIGKEGCVGVDLEAYRQWEGKLPSFREQLKDIELWILDVDGTLTPKDIPELNAEFQSALSRLGSNFLGRDEEELRSLIEEEYREGRSTTNYLQGLDVPREMIAEAYSNVNKANYLRRDPVLLAMFEVFGDRRKAIATSSSRKENEGAFRVLGLNKKDFDPIICLEDVKNSKPDREIFDRVISDSGVAAERCVSIGDRIEKDMRSAARAGMKTILVGEESEETTAWVPRIYDLPRLFV